MQRLLLFIPIAFLFLVNSCAVIPPMPVNPLEKAVEETLTAIASTPVPTLTPNPNIPNLIGWLNNDLSAISPLGLTLDAEYHVINMSFSNASHGVLFRVDMGCICMNSEKCCTPERTFVVLAESMKRNSNTVLAQLSGNISEILVVCSDQQTKEQIGAMIAPWQDMQGYLQGYVSGYQLGVLVKQTSVP